MTEHDKQEKLTDLAQRIALLRDSLGYSQEEFAKLINIDIETYKEYEKTGFDIPISVLFHISNVCNVDMAEILTGTSAKLDTYQIVHAGQGREISRFPGYHFKDLAYKYTHKRMQPLLVTLDPNNKPTELVVHEGQEFNYVLDGEMTLVFADREVNLSKGDSVYFDPRLPHGQKTATDKPATFLTMILE
jgi:transcriptional regulator with XRE-family HTH domain